jgi:Tfp pilus assembly protein PilF
MTRKLLILLGLAAFLPWASCAGERAGEKEYGEIINSGAPGEEMIAALENFERRHGGHFDSKVDLGLYYLAAGDAGRAADYLRRAELLGGGDSSGAKVPAMYSALAHICLAGKDYQGALEYAGKAIEADGENKKNYRFLKGHILVARQEYGEALAIFDELLGEDGDWDGEEDLKAHMFLLAQAEQPARAAGALDRYLRTGAFFPGLGYFGAAVYRAAGDMEKAACALYLEQEYRSGYGDLQDSGAGPLPDEINLEEGRGDYFAAEYLALKNLLNGGGPEAFSAGDFLRLVELEPYFRLFPSFYWNLWRGARLAYPEDYRYFSPALQKIIALDKDGPFARGAWEELTRLMGY